MKFDEQFCEILDKLMDTASDRLLVESDFKEACEFLHVSKMYYEIEHGDSGRYMDFKSNRLVLPGKMEGEKIILFDNGEKTALCKQYDYRFVENNERVHAYIEFREGVDEQSLELKKYQFMANIVYLLVSRQNMRFMLNYTEIMDDHTGIPNSLYIKREYDKVIKKITADKITVLYINLQNFKYFNEIGGVKCGDEAISRYARQLLKFIEEDEGVCHLDSDNFILFVKNENLDEVIRNLQSVHLEKLSTLPDISFDITAWIGISGSMIDDTRTILTRIEEAAIACKTGKNQKINVMVYSQELEGKTKQDMELVAMFPQAVRDREIRPFFQAKVDMTTGELVGFESLCRWIHNGKFIYPVQFIPLLEREGLVNELDMAIFTETCRAIRSWKDMGLNPPCVSFNFSRLNLFIPDIEHKIFQVLEDNKISCSDIEVEITETVNESEYSRLVEFVRSLKDKGIHVSIDDFGTGFSSLSLIHNIDADVINIANHMNMSVIVEGVETAEQARELMRFGCKNVQGFLYSRPVDYKTATEMIRNPQFKAV